MSRTKTVYPSSEVFHLWANRAISHDIRNASGNISTRNCGAVLVSYGSGFAMGGYFTRADGESVLLINDERYSATTSKHQLYTWRALPRHRADDCIRVPRLRLDNFRDASALAEVARACIDDARATLEKCEKARSSFSGHVYSARRMLESARKIYAFTGDKKNAAAIPTLAEDCDKTRAAEVMRIIGAAEFMRLAAVALTDAKHKQSRAIDAAEFYAQSGPVSADNARHWHGRRDSARGVCETAAECIRAAEKSRGYYIKAGRKPAPDIARIVKTASAIETAHAQAAQTERENEYSANLHSDALRAIRGMASAARQNRNNRRNGKRAHVYTNLARHYGGRMMEEFGFKGESRVFPADLVPLCQRLTRYSAAGQLIEAVEAAEAYATDFDVNANILPTSAHVRNAMIRCANDNPRMIQPGSHWQTRADAIIAKADTQRAEYVAAAMARNAAAIQAWRNGERAYLPSAAPTMARIVGNTVETSRGARVPLAHAARLVRLAERIANRGGSTWQPGTGPRVGHYQVQAIGADFSAIIGCHEFSPAESLRIIADIKQTAEYRAETVAAE